MKAERKKAQTTMALLFLVVIIFSILAIFLLSFAQTLSQGEYMQKYLNNMLLSIVKTDTGYTDSSCKSISDAMACSFLQPTFPCGGTERCRDIAVGRVTYYVDRFEAVKQSYRYFLKVEPQGFVPRDDQNMPIKLEIGDPTVEDADSKLIASYTLSAVSGPNSFLFKVYLIITEA